MASFFLYPFAIFGTEVKVLLNYYRYIKKYYFLSSIVNKCEPFKPNDLRLTYGIAFSVLSITQSLIVIHFCKNIHYFPG